MNSNGKAPDFKTGPQGVRRPFLEMVREVRKEVRRKLADEFAGGQTAISEKVRRGSQQVRRQFGPEVRSSSTTPIGVVLRDRTRDGSNFAWPSQARAGACSLRASEVAEIIWRGT